MTALPQWLWHGCCLYLSGYDMTASSVVTIDGWYGMTAGVLFVYTVGGPI